MSIDCTHTWPGKRREMVCDECAKLSEQPVGLSPNDGLKTTSSNGEHYQCKICGGNPTSFPYKPEHQSFFIGSKAGPRKPAQPDECRHIFGNMADWPRPCMTCGKSEVEIIADQVRQIVEDGKRKPTPYELLHTPMTAKAPSNSPNPPSSPERESIDQDIVNLAVNMESLLTTHDRSNAWEEERQKRLLQLREFLIKNHWARDSIPERAKYLITQIEGHKS